MGGDEAMAAAPTYAEPAAAEAESGWRSAVRMPTPRSRRLSSPPDGYEAPPSSQCRGAGLQRGAGRRREPVYEEPVYEEPVYEAPTSEPVYEEPAAAPATRTGVRGAGRRPVYEEPVYEEPAAEPVYEEPVYERSRSTRSRRRSRRPPRSRASRCSRCRGRLRRGRPRPEPGFASRRLDSTEKVYYGEPMTITLKDADVKDVLALLRPDQRAQRGGQPGRLGQGHRRADQRALGPGARAGAQDQQPRLRAGRQHHAHRAAVPSCARRPRRSSGCARRRPCRSRCRP